MIGTFKSRRGPNIYLFNKTKKPMNQTFSDLMTHSFYLRELENDPLRLLAEISTLQKNWLEHSVQIVYTPCYTFPSQQTGQYILAFQHPLIGYSFSTLPSTESGLVAARPLNKENQQQVLIKNPQFTASKTQCTAPSKGLEHRTNPTRQSTSAKCNKNGADHCASQKAKKAKATYNKTLKNRLKQKIRNARSVGFRSAKRNGFIGIAARIFGEFSAQKKKAELLQNPPFGLSVDVVKEYLKS